MQQCFEVKLIGENEVSLDSITLAWAVVDRVFDLSGGAEPFQRGKEGGGSTRVPNLTLHFLFSLNHLCGFILFLIIHRIIDNVFDNILLKIYARKSQLMQGLFMSKRFWSS